MSLRLDIRSDRELHLLKMLASGARKWEDLNELEKEIVFRSRINVTGVVEPKKLEEYRRQVALDGRLGRREKAKAIAKELAAPIKRRLE